MMKVRFLQRTVRKYQALRRERVDIWTRQWLRAEPRVIRLAQLRHDPETLEAAAAQAVRDRLQKDAAGGPNGSGLGAAAHVILKRTAEGGKAKLAELRLLERDVVAVDMLPQFERLERLAPTPPEQVRAFALDMYRVRYDTFRRDYHAFIRAERDARENERWASRHGGKSFAAAAASVHSRAARKCPRLAAYLKHREVLGFILATQQDLPENIAQAKRIADGTEKEKAGAAVAQTETTQTLLNLVNLLKNPATAAKEAAVAAATAEASGGSSMRRGRRASAAGQALARSDSVRAPNSPTQETPQRTRSTLGRSPSSFSGR